MTRINVIPVYELSDQHLLAEYRELPRVLKQDISLDDSSEFYHLGVGHMKWARRHWKFTLDRFYKLVSEMRYRGYSPNYSPETLGQYIVELSNEWPYADYVVREEDLELNRTRIYNKYKEHPTHYTWTKRPKPEWLDCAKE